jgi:titin
MIWILCGFENLIFSISLCWYCASDPPGPPVNVLVDDITKTGCQLTWEPPENDGGSPITGYMVERCNGYSSRWTKVTKTPVTERQMRFEELHEGDEYEFRVSAVNAAGQGKPSESSGRFTAKDPFDVPGKPEAPTVEDMSPEVASVAWAPPASDGGSPITGYTLEMRRVGDVKWKPASKDATPDTKLTVEGLMDGEEYEFRVTAHNKAGPGAPSAPSKPAKYGKQRFGELINFSTLHYFYSLKNTIRRNAFW